MGWEKKERRKKNWHHSIGCMTQARVNVHRSSCEARPSRGELFISTAKILFSSKTEKCNTMT